MIPTPEAGARKERPVLYSAPMALASLDDRKTMTRRLLKLPPWVEDEERAVFTLNEMARAGKTPGLALFKDGRPVKRWTCPFGGRGDVLWGRETWRPVMEGWRSFVEYAAGGPNLDNINRELLAGLSRVALRFAGARQERHSEAWHPGIHMPRWASRLSQEVTALRFERLWDITEEDALAEGVAIPAGGRYVVAGHPEFVHNSALGCFNTLWNLINGAESFEANPLVIVVSFKRVRP